ncbi:carotene biosynthesis protein [Cyclobacterium xiamenense]|uniref:carotene biosynthesis protein n=1 Tax=Cyclobacterium xiamenense TaxID=1297121 RepID=UPI0012B7BF39|nr:carotene biosynthesis protein [Cyclobacterium xiamenense]
MKTFLGFMGIAIGLVGIAYGVPRTDFPTLLGLYVLAFLSYLYLLSVQKKQALSPLILLSMALGLRVLLLGAWPELSDDFYRYIFDGQLLANGINPYLELPLTVRDSGLLPENPYWETLLDRMNSPAYFSLYPPLHQFFFWLAALPGENLFLNVLVLRATVLLAEGINLWLIQKLLFRWRMPSYRLSWYAFNPLVILELTGNLHFEGWVLTGLLFAVYAYDVQKPPWAGLSWAASIGLKLTPLLLAPVWIRFWGKHQFWKFTLVSVLVVLLLLSPIVIAGGAENFFQSFRLYQSKFEFNASLYYLIRAASGYFVDYNPIAYVGPALQGLAAIALLTMGLYQRTFTREALVSKMVWMYLVFFLLQTTVHPWYLIPAVGISVLTTNRIFVAWSGLVFLSYHVYARPEYTESMGMVATEYLLLAIVIVLTAYRHFASRRRLSSASSAKSESL